MAVRECIDRIHEWRSWGLEPYHHSKLARLAYLESKIPDFLSNRQIAPERAQLICSISDERMERVVARTLRSADSNTVLKSLELKKQKLSDFLEKIDKETFEALPSEMQHLFLRALRIHQVSTQENPFPILQEIQTPLIFLKGKTLGEQMVHFYEMIHVLEIQKNTVQRLQEIQDKNLHEQKEVLQGMHKMKEIEEFDRLTLLYTKIDLQSWNELVQHASPRVQEWLTILKAEAVKREQFHSDGRFLYQWRGAHPDVDTTRFQVFAPHARQVKLLLTAYGKQEHCLSMERKGFGVFEVRTHQAFTGRTYRYLIEDCHGHWKARTDPFGLAVIETNNGVESVVSDRASYTWNDQDWMDKRQRSHPSQKPLSIYELHVDSWKKKHGRPMAFRELAHEIVSYQKKIPFTHIQLYGVLDNKNDFSWGYQVDHFFAPNRRLGNADDFKFLVDLFHQNHIGVIIDWIPTHYKHEHNGDYSQSLHDYDGTNLFGSESCCWGTMFFDFNKPETRRLLLASALYWFEEMHVDGLRVDAVSPMVRRNGSEQGAAIEFLKELNYIVHERYPGIIMIAEDTDGVVQVAREGLGFDAKLGVHQQSRTRNYFRTPYGQRSWNEHHHEKLLLNLGEMGQEDWVVSHSHDDSAAGAPHRHSTVYGSLPTADSWQKFADMRLFHALNLLTPGFGHAIHMGDEIGQRWPWNERLRCEEGAVEWHLLDHHPESSFHRGLQECVGDLHRLYRSRQAFWKHRGQGYQLISQDAHNRVIGFHRFDREGGRLALFFNFSPTGYKEYDFPLPPLQEDPELFWVKGAKEIFNTDGVQYGGTGQFINTWAGILKNPRGNPTHFHFAFPPLSVLVFEETWY
jgi:1,4-alpha-glucan branching enzyme